MAEPPKPKEGKLIQQALAAKQVYNEACNFQLKAEVRNEKWKQPRKCTVVLGNNRIYFFKQGGKLDFDIHYWDLLEVKCDKPGEITLRSRGDVQHTIVPVHLSVLDEVVRGLHFLWNMDFSGIMDGFKLKITPEGKLKSILGADDVAAADETDGSCGGFLITYISMCDLSDVAPSEEVVWEIENVVAPRETTEFDFTKLGKRDQLLGAPLRPVMLTIGITNYFTSLKMRNMKLSAEGFLAIAACLSLSGRISKLVLKSVGLSKDGMSYLCEALNLNSHLPLSEIDISNNNIDDKSFVIFAEMVRKNTRITSLNIANCGGSKSAMSALLEAMAANDHFAKNLAYLNIAGNRLDQEGTTHLSNLIANCQNLTVLSVANCNVHLPNLRKCFSLKTFDFSGNQIKKKDNMHLEFIRFLRTVSSLTSLSLARTYLAPETFNDLFGKNSPFAALEKLDISDNEFADEALSSLLELIQAHMNSLASVNLSYNFTGKTKVKSRVAALDTLSNTLSKKVGTPISTLILQGNPKSQIKTDLAPLLFALMNNTTLTTLDISGQAVGDLAAIALGKILQANNTITTLSWDDNHTTSVGFSQFVAGLKRNKSVVNLAMPLNDISQAINSESTPEKLQKIQHIIDTLQSLCVRNIPTISRPAAEETPADGEVTLEVPKSPVLQQVEITKVSSPPRSPRPRMSAVRPTAVDLKSSIAVYPELKAFSGEN